jgi:diacylglycerol kinase (ATP)
MLQDPVEKTNRNPRQALPTALQSVGIIYNPASGAGRGKLIAELTAKACEEHGLRVFLRQTERSYAPASLDSYLSQADVVLGATGDGSASALLPALGRTGKPFYMMPSGNESIFARYFCMRSDPEAVIDALREWQIGYHYYGVAGGRPFFCLASLGLDSEVVAATHANRNGPIGHVGYVMPAIQAALKHTPPRLRLMVDGRQVLNGEQGYLIIANIPDYALNMRPVPEARSEKPLLSARFFPGHGCLQTACWFLGAFMGAQPDLSGSRLFEGRRFQIEVLDRHPYPVQADRDPAGYAPLEICVSNQPVKILQTPAGRR